MNRGTLAAIVFGAGLAGAAAYYVQERMAGNDRNPDAGTELVENRDPGTLNGLVETLPQVQLPDRAGQPRSLHDWPGKSLVINFWATWCAPCRREIPLLQRIEREYGPNGFQVVGIAVDFRDKVIGFADQMRIDYPLLIGEQEALDAASAFGIEAIGLPFTVFTDARGRVVAAHLGELHETQARLILDAVAAVNAGKRTPQQARSEIAAAAE